MKTFRNLLATFIVIAALGLVPAFAQNTMRVTADIPFAFTAGTQTLPAGQYVFVADANSAIALLYNADAGKGVAVLTALNTGTGSAKDASLTFHRYGNKSYLAAVWSSLSGSGRVMTATKGEREAEKANTPREVAYVRAYNQ